MAAIGRDGVIKVVAALLAVALMAACGGDGQTSVVRDESERLDAEPGQASAAVTAVSDLGWDLFHELADDTNNLVFSPHSIGIALAMTRTGAVGDTAAEMDEVLHLVGIDDPNRSLNALDLALTSSAGTKDRPDGTTDEVALDIANGLWAQDGLQFEQPFLMTLAENYGAGVRLVDYQRDAEAARADINDWVAGRTKDRIEELIAPGVLSTRTRLVLANALYLQAPWLYPFEAEATTEGPFALLDGSETQVELMSTSESFRYGRGDRWQAVELPYLGGDLSLLVVVPDHGAFEAVTSTLHTAAIDGIVTSLETGQVNLRLPAFEFSTDAGLVPVFQALGLRLPFDPDVADFSAMTSEAPLYVSDVVHQAVIAVDEAGTEAAAATAVVMDLTAAPAEAVDLIVDRPFIFVLRHNSTGGVLFIGQLLDP